MISQLPGQIVIWKKRACFDCCVVRPWWNTTSKGKQKKLGWNAAPGPLLRPCSSRRFDVTSNPMFRDKTPNSTASSARGKRGKGFETTRTINYSWDIILLPLLLLLLLLIIIIIIIILLLLVPLLVVVEMMMEQNRFWVANNFSVTKENQCIFSQQPAAFEALLNVS